MIDAMLNHLYMKLFPIMLFLLCLSANVSTAQEVERYTEEQIKAIDEYMAAKVEMYKERYDLAIPLLMDIHKKDRTNGMVAYDLAIAYEATEDYSSADKYASIATRYMPDNLWVKLYYGKLMIKMEKYQEGAKAFSQLVQLDPADFSHIENYAKCLSKAGDDKKALEVLNEWQKDHEFIEHISKLKYDLYMRRNDKNNAEKELKMLSDSDPYNTRYLNNLATFYTTQKKTKEAREIYEKILSIDPNDNKANTAMVALASQDKKEAPFLRSLLPIIEKPNIDADSKIRELIPFINQLTETFNPETAASLGELTKTLTLIHPEHAAAHAINGDLLFLSEDYGGAIQAYEKTLTLDDTKYPVWQQLMQSLLYTEAIDQLAEKAYSAIDLFPNQGDAYFFYGLARNETGQVNDAMDFLQEGLLIAGRDITIKSNLLAELARSYHLQGQSDKANEKVEESLKLSKGNNPYALEVKGDILNAAGQKEEARKLWTKAQNLGLHRASLAQKLNQ
jgi:tetratricopeptide (TPR) repeat protein